MNLSDLDDKVAAAVIAAAGTVIGALIQLRVAWRKEVSERARGVPVTKKSRRGPVWAVGLLLVAAAVGGFALSQYVFRQSDHDSSDVRGELQTQLKQISAMAERLERASLRGPDAAGRAPDVFRGAEAATVATTIGPCRARAAAADAVPGCAEADAEGVTLCAAVPSVAVVTDTTLYARVEESRQPWTESQVAPGQDLGHARFPDKPFERPESDQTKDVCTTFASWDGEHSYRVRLVVKYVVGGAASAVSNASLVPTSGVGH